jgi:hypothetical protein
MHFAFSRLIVLSFPRARDSLFVQITISYMMLLAHSTAAY